VDSLTYELVASVNNLLVELQLFALACQALLQVLDLHWVELHQLILLLQKAQLALELRFQVRNSVLALVRCLYFLAVYFTGLLDLLLAPLDQLFFFLQNLLGPDVLLVYFASDLFFLFFLFFYLLQQLVQL
jgi:hypothetical protein